MRATPEDFRVDEIDAFEASGAGEHLLLTIEKRGMNTAFAAKRLAQWAGIAEMGVSYAGLKDRHAVTTQRFSVHLPKKIAPDLAALESDDLRVLAFDVARAQVAARRAGGQSLRADLARGRRRTRRDRRAPARDRRRAACRTSSANNASAAKATTWRRRWRCSPAAA